MTQLRQLSLCGGVRLGGGRCRDRVDCSSTWPGHGSLGTTGTSVVGTVMAPRDVHVLVLSGFDSVRWKGN